MACVPIKLYLTVFIKADDELDLVCRPRITDVWFRARQRYMGYTKSKNMSCKYL